MQQIYHPSTLWEDWINGMWRLESKSYQAAKLGAIITVTGDHIAYGKAMLRVIKEWPYSCEHNLSNASINRRAWLGHAACCIEYNYPEYLVREAWGHLSQLQQDLANDQAEQAIYLWEENYVQKSIDNARKNRSVRQTVGIQVLS